MVRQRMTGGQAVAATLAAQGIEVLFGIPGGHSLPVYDGLLREKGIRHVLGRHEQGLAYMADGYSRACGKIGAVTVTSGPAVANMAAALGGVTTDTAAVLAIASTVRSDLVGRDRGGLHDLRNSIDIMRPVCRHVEQCDAVEQIPFVLADLVSRLRTGRPGAAFCQIPADILAAEAEVELPASMPGDRPTGDRQAIADAVELLARAQRPVIWAGTGATIAGADPEVAELARRLGAIVVTSNLGRGIIPSDDEHAVMKEGMRLTEVDALIGSADVVLAVGTMFKEEDTCVWQTRLGEKLVHIDIDPEEIGRSYKATVGIVADAKKALAAVLGQLPARQPADRSWLTRGKEAQAAYVARRARENPTEMAALKAFAGAVPGDAIVVCDRCNLGYWAWCCLPARYPRSFQYPMGYGSLGGALPQAIGAKIAAPERPVICVIGDGGLQFTLPELIVAVQEHLPITILLCNNELYGAIAAGMKRNFGTDEIGCHLVNPDFQAIARAYSVPARRVDRIEDLGPALRSAVASGALNMLEFTVPLAAPPP